QRPRGPQGALRGTAGTSAPSGYPDDAERAALLAGGSSSLGLAPLVPVPAHRSDRSGAGAGMSFVEDFPNVVVGQVRIDLGGRDRRVPQELLDVAEGHAAAQQVSGHAVA